MEIKVLSEKVRKSLEVLQQGSVNDELVKELTKDFETNDLKEFYAIISFVLKFSQVEVIK